MGEERGERALEGAARDVLERVTDAVVAYDREFRVTYVNAAGEAYFGRARGELMGRVIWDVFPAALGTEAEARLRDAMRSSTPIEYALFSPAMHRWVEVRAFPAPDGLTVYFHDVTERKRAESALELLSLAGAVLGESLDVEATLSNVARLLVPRLADLCLVDLLEDGVLRRVAAFHRDPARLAAMEAVRRERRNPRRPGILRVLETGEPELVPAVDDAWLCAAAADEEHLARLRAVAPRSILCVPLRAQQRTLGVLALVMLDDERRFGPDDLPLARVLADRAGVAIEHARQHALAIEARRLRDDVLGVVSHDLRNPLHTIRLAAEIVSRVTHLPEAGRILRSVTRADRLIQDLLLAARIDGGTLPLERELEPVAPIVDEVVEANATLAAEKSVTLEAAVDDGVDRALVDRARLVQLLGNLVGNAIKFTPAGGLVRLRARVDGAWLAIDVSDTGVGISEEERAHLFDRFWQGAHARRAGAGLGLAIAKGIAEAHGGGIEVRSAPGEGAVFSVRVPR